MDISYKDIIFDLRGSKVLYRKYYRLMEHMILEVYRGRCYVDMGDMVLGFNNEVQKRYGSKGTLKGPVSYIEVDGSKREDNDEVVRIVYNNGKKRYFKGYGEPILDSGRERGKS